MLLSSVLKAENDYKIARRIVNKEFQKIFRERE